MTTNQEFIASDAPGRAGATAVVRSLHAIPVACRDGRLLN
jgi:hypothetical protein